MQLTRNDIDYTSLRLAISALNAQGCDLGSNDGHTWIVISGSDKVFKIIVHVNFNCTISGQKVFNHF
jgi:hypothetical protein